MDRRELLRAVARIVGLQPASRLGTVLIGAGLLMLAYAAGMYVDILPGNRVVVPRAPALEGRLSTDAPPADAPAADAPAADAPSADQVVGAAPTESAEPAPTIVEPSVSSELSVSSEPSVSAVPEAVPTDLSASYPAAASESSAQPAPGTAEVAATSAAPVGEAALPTVDLQPAPADVQPAAADSQAAPAGPAQVAEAADATSEPVAVPIALVPSDAADRPYNSDRPPPGRATELKIPSIKIETRVVPAGVVQNKNGEPEWETVPFVAAHYAETSLVGARGNAVISGHVVTIQEGNVFRNLYLIKPGDKIETRTEEGVFTYVVSGLKEVAPTAVEVMAPTPEPILTLITCAGQFDRRSRTFSHRLVVTARLVEWSRSAGG